MGAQSLKCTVQSAQLKPPTKTQILCPHPLENLVTQMYRPIRTIKTPQQNSNFMPPPSQKMSLPAHQNSDFMPPTPRLNGQGGPFFLEVKNSGLNA